MDIVSGSVNQYPLPADHHRFRCRSREPDFSGEWILNRQASTLSPGADAVRSGVVRIEHRAPSFRYKAAFVSEGGPLQYEYELLSAGREIVSTQQGITTVSSLRWEGDALVATWRTSVPMARCRSLSGTNCSTPDVVFARRSNSGEMGETKTRLDVRAPLRHPIRHLFSAKLDTAS